MPNYIHLHIHLQSSLLHCIALVKGRRSGGDRRPHILHHSRGPLKRRWCGVFRGRFACRVIPRGVGGTCQLLIANESFPIKGLCAWSLKLT